MAPHSSTLASKIPWTEEPDGLQSMGLRRVGQDWATSLSLFTFMHWRRKWQPTPVFLPGESLGRGSLVGCRLWGHTESDTTEATQQQQQQQQQQAGDVGDAGSIVGLGRFPGIGNGNPLQQSCEENSMDRGAQRPQSMDLQSQTERLSTHTQIFSNYF